jgi:hypothetical protein
LNHRKELLAYITDNKITSNAQLDAALDHLGKVCSGVVGCCAKPASWSPRLQCFCLLAVQKYWAVLLSCQYAICVMQRRQHVLLSGLLCTEQCWLSG